MSVRQSRFDSDRLSAGARRGGAVSDRHSDGVSRTAKTNLQRVCAEGGKSGIMPSVGNARRRGDRTRKFRADEVKCAETHGSNHASEGIRRVGVRAGVGRRAPWASFPTSFRLMSTAKRQRNGFRRCGCIPVFARHRFVRRVNASELDPRVTSSVTYDSCSRPFGFARVVCARKPALGRV